MSQRWGKGWQTFFTNFLLNFLMIIDFINTTFCLSYHYFLINVFGIRKCERMTHIQLRAFRKFMVLSSYNRPRHTGQKSHQPIIKTLEKIAILGTHMKLLAFKIGEWEEEMSASLVRKFALSPFLDLFHETFRTCTTFSPTFLKRKF